MVGNLVIDGTAKQRNTKGTVPCSLEKNSLTIVDRGDCSEHFGSGTSGARKQKEIVSSSETKLRLWKGKGKNLVQH
jgi:hypothetical protein